MLPLLMLEGVEAHILPFAGTHMLLLLAEGTTQQNICLYSFITQRSRPTTFPHPIYFRRPPYRQQKKHVYQ